MLPGGTVSPCQQDSDKVAQWMLMFITKLVAEFQCREQEPFQRGKRHSCFSFTAHDEILPVFFQAHFPPYTFSGADCAEHKALGSSS